MKKRTAILILTLITIFCFVPMSASAAESNVIRVSNQKEFEEAIARVNKDSDSEYTIELTADFSVNGFSITSPHKTTILGSGHTLTMGGGGSVHVSKGAELTLGAADGNALNIRSAEGMSNDVPGMLNIEGTCNMYSGVTLSGREGNNYFGGGVTVSGGTFHMYGGTIEKCGIEGGSVCYGGGVLAVALKSPAAASLENTTVKGNKATTGAGIASYESWTNLSIKGCTVTENTAQKYGGGFSVESNTGGGKTTITDTVLCNNIADTAGSDVYLKKSPLVLPSAPSMNSIYLGAPEDVRNQKIDGWYEDKTDSRYTEQEKAARKEYTGQNQGKGGRRHLDFQGI